MPSLSSNAARPVPQQERAARTRSLFLDTAEKLFVEVGYDAATMTAVAERANTSIGALYRWFPDKAALGSALMVRYSQEIEEHWAPVLCRRGAGCDAGVRCHDDRNDDGFLPRKTCLFRAARGADQTLPGARRTEEPARGICQGPFDPEKPALSHDRAYLIANVVIDTMKGFLAGAASAAPKEQHVLTVEFTTMLSLYLKSIFD